MTEVKRTAPQEAGGCTISDSTIASQAMVWGLLHTTVRGEGIRDRMKALYRSGRAWDYEVSERLADGLEKVFWGITVHAKNDDPDLCWVCAYAKCDLPMSGLDEVAEWGERLAERVAWFIGSEIGNTAPEEDVVMDGGLEEFF